AMEMLVNGRGLTFDIIERTVVIRKQDAVQDMKLVTIKGRIRDKNKNPIPGATVLIVGSTRGVASDPEGNFSISAQPTDVLRVSFIGYDSKTIEIRGKTFIEVVLEESEEQLEEVVANGIYTRNIESFTGSISTFKGEELKTIGAQNILRSLSALDPSVIITENNLQGSNPNARMDITINGKMSITDLEQEYETDPNQPLFILDGFETTLQTIVDLNMDRVESISILKDASSTAIYGSKATNGGYYRAKKPIT
ncbi:MAG: carboxypeptidase-like regulatory domain-containing protein, partial [Butyricimonas faecihominis]